MTSATRDRAPVRGFVTAVLGGVYFAIVAFLVAVPGGTWTTRGLIVLAASIPLMLVMVVAGLWRLVGGPAGWRFTRWHWLVFCSPAAVLLVFAVVVLASGRSLS